MSVHQFTVRAADGSPKSLAEYAGTPMLIVNTASKCGFTYQYEGLEALYRKFGGKLVVIAFPCNQFGAQEPGDAAEIANFCRTSYDVTFPVMAKIEVNGAGADPLYKYLKSSKPGLLGTETIKWNFTKFLINKEGLVVGRYAPTDKPESLTAKIEGLI